MSAPQPPDGQQGQGEQPYEGGAQPPPQGGDNPFAAAEPTQSIRPGEQPPAGFQPQDGPEPTQSVTPGSGQQSDDEAEGTQVLGAPGQQQPGADSTQVVGPSGAPPQPNYGQSYVPPAPDPGAQQGYQPQGFMPQGDPNAGGFPGQQPPQGFAPQGGDPYGQQQPPQQQAPGQPPYVQPAPGYGPPPGQGFGGQPGGGGNMLPVAQWVGLGVGILTFILNIINVFGGIYLTSSRMGSMGAQILGMIPALVIVGAIVGLLASIAVAVGSMLGGKGNPTGRLVVLGAGAVGIVAEILAIIGYKVGDIFCILSILLFIGALVLWALPAVNTALKEKAGAGASGPGGPGGPFGPGGPGGPAGPGGPGGPGDPYGQQPPQQGGFPGQPPQQQGGFPGQAPQGPPSGGFPGQPPQGPPSGGFPGQPGQQPGQPPQGPPPGQQGFPPQQW